MIPKKWLAPLALILGIGCFLTPAFGKEITGWIKSEACSVYEKPATESKTIGTIKQKAAVTVEDAGSGWMKILFAPVRDPKTGNYIDAKAHYIQKRDMTEVDPCKW